MSVAVPDGSLLLPLQRTSEEVREPDYVFDLPLIRFVAYQPDCRLFGWVRLDATRLTDLLNAAESVCLENVEIADFGRGSLDAADRIVVPRRELVAVHASGPRGDEGKRRPTSVTTVTVSIGSYVIGGSLHGVDGTDPMASLAERGPMVPLTDAWLEYASGGERVHRSTGTIIFNRDLADAVRA
jgi:hypothetical protein